MMSLLAASSIDASRSEEDSRKVHSCVPLVYLIEERSRIYPSLRPKSLQISPDEAAAIRRHFDAGVDRVHALAEFEVPQLSSRRVALYNPGPKWQTIDCARCFVSATARGGLADEVKVSCCVSDDVIEIVASSAPIKLLPL